ncbi:hypothetical protein LIER_34449 [Lithospermum erythrorhizon]|uniref:Uncharacterized protein n=1 Tax=Lithospermum erythrorhizon TaxID=34254 RepID=A0AAV3RZJ5_LITER
MIEMISAKQGQEEPVTDFFNRAHGMELSIVANKGKGTGTSTATLYKAKVEDVEFEEPCNLYKAKVEDVSRFTCHNFQVNEVLLQNQKNTRRY